MSGLAAAELFSSAHASLEVNAQDGQLPHLVLAPGAEPLQVRKIAVHLVLQEGIFKLEDGQLETPGATYQFGGTGSARGGLDLKLTRNGVPEFNITGTLAQPRVESVSAEAQAALKP
jgi:hypothetical protein